MHNEMVEEKAKLMARDNLDPKIKTLVFALNKEGFRTIASCQGHSSDEVQKAMAQQKISTPTYRVGSAFITIVGYNEEKFDKLKTLIRQHTSLPFEIHSSIGGNNWEEHFTNVEFAGAM